MVEFEIEGYDGANGLLLLTRRGSAVTADWSTVAEGMTVEARVLEGLSDAVFAFAIGFKAPSPV